MFPTNRGSMTINKRTAVPTFAAVFFSIICAAQVCWSQTISTFDVLVATETLTVVGTTTLQGNAFSVGGSTLVAKDGFVGIGTTTPNFLLHVWGPGAVSQQNEMFMKVPRGAFRFGQRFL